MSDERVVIEQPTPGVTQFRSNPSGKLMAQIVSSETTSSGITFLTSNDEQFQVGLLGWKSGHRIPAHSHRVIPREIDRTSEVLFIRKGKVEMSLFTDDGYLLTKSTLWAGDVVALFEGGHGFEILEDAEIVEVKQGPYLGEDEKYRFESDKQ